MREGPGRVGVLGGTFDPPHVGHLVAAVNIRYELDLDLVLLVPANVPWQKVGIHPVTEAPHRVAMTRALAAGVPGVRVSTIEIARGGDSFTADTLRQLTERQPNTQHFLLVGSDVAPTLDTWRRPDELKSLATLVVHRRAGQPGQPPPGWSHLDVVVPSVDASSTDVRARVAQGRPIDGLVPSRVARYIERHGLYRDEAAA